VVGAGVARIPQSGRAQGLGVERGVLFVDGGGLAVVSLNIELESAQQLQ
jgi:hypothetical protein